MNPSYVTEFSWWVAKNYTHLRINGTYIKAYPFTYTVDEALEDFCEYQGHIFKSICFMPRLGYCVYGAYKWKRL